LIIRTLLSLLLAESGTRFEHGNFGWSGEIAMSIAFIESAFLILEAPPLPSWKIAAAHSMLVLHLLSGATLAAAFVLRPLT